MNPAPLNPLVTNLLSRVRETASTLQEQTPNDHSLNKINNIDISSVLEIVEEIKSVEQLGLSHCSKPLVEYFNETNGVIYLPVGAEDGLWTCGCFVIPPNGKIPLHDHPEMTGLIRVLEGSVEIESYDLCQNSPSLAYPCGKSIFESPSTAHLEPTVANIHQVQAGSQGATFLDILMPDYDDDKGRCCNFYKLVKLSSPEMIPKKDKVANNQAAAEDEDLDDKNININSNGHQNNNQSISGACELIICNDVSNEVNIFTGQWPMDDDSNGRKSSSLSNSPPLGPSSKLEPPCPPTEMMMMTTSNYHHKNNDVILSNNKKEEKKKSRKKKR
jgi:cysteamine dioxygenase